MSFQYPAAENQLLLSAHSRLLLAESRLIRNTGSRSPGSVPAATFTHCPWRIPRLPHGSLPYAVATVVPTFWRESPAQRKEDLTMDGVGRTRKSWGHPPCTTGAPPGPGDSALSSARQRPRVGSERPAFFLVSPNPQAAQPGAQAGVGILQVWVMKGRLKLPRAPDASCPRTDTSRTQMSLSPG